MRIVASRNRVSLTIVHLGGGLTHLVASTTLGSVLRAVLLRGPRAQARVAGWSADEEPGRLRSVGGRDDLVGDSDELRVDAGRVGPPDAAVAQGLRGGGGEEGGGGGKADDEAARETAGATAGGRRRRGRGGGGAARTEEHGGGGGCWTRRSR